MSDDGARQRASGTGPRGLRVITDAVSQLSGVALVLACLAVFLAAVIGGLSLIGSLGFFGWIAYVVVLSVLALGLGPVIATGVSLRQKGSARHRQEAEQRLHEQRRKFALESTFGEARARAAGAERTRPPEA